MEQNKGFWYADWSFPIFVGLLSSGVFAGTHMYYLYGIGAFNEVAFVAMLKSGIDTGVYGAVAAFGASFLFARIIEGSLVGSSISAARYRPVSASAYRRCCSARALSSRWRISPRRWSPAWSSAWRWATSSFWRVSSPSTRAIPPTAPT